ncbi:MAG: hypothetical protein NXY57DRAFT_308165 [Lentinula lateritia]|nr:MAG: hypothetical protein NXY57DRAFT_308165 [Lentinula lateritia]
MFLQHLFKSSCVFSPPALLALFVCSVSVVLVIVLPLRLFKYSLYPSACRILSLPNRLRLIVSCYSFVCLICHLLYSIICLMYSGGWHDQAFEDI